MRSSYGMFGFYRFFLASCILLAHSGTGDYWHLGRHAVVMFFVLSAFIVSTAYTTRYQDSQSGLGRYYLNRFLRVYPLYWVVLTLSVASLALFPDINKELYKPISLISPLVSRESLGNWVSNITLLGTTNFSGSILRPYFILASWPVGIEILYWIIIPGLLVYRPLRLFLYAFAVLYTAFVVGVEISQYPKIWYPLRYYSPLSAALPFAIGIGLFEIKKRYGVNIPHVYALIVTLAYGALLYLLPEMGWQRDMLGHYGALLLGSMLVYYLSFADPGTLWRLLPRGDALLGNITYGMLLLSNLAAGYLILFTSLRPGGMLFFSGCFVLTMVMAYVAYRFVERPVASLRRQVRAAPDHLTS